MKSRKSQTNFTLHKKKLLNSSHFTAFNNCDTDITSKNTSPPYQPPHEKGVTYLTTRARQRFFGYPTSFLGQSFTSRDWRFLTGVRAPHQDEVGYERDGIIATGGTRFAIIMYAMSKRRHITLYSVILSIAWPRIAGIFGNVARNL